MKFKEAEIRALITQVSQDYISFSRFVEIINSRIEDTPDKLKLPLDVEL